MACPLLIALPHGLIVSGVAVWAVRLAEAWARRGRPAALLLHREPPGHDRLELASDAVERVELGHLPRLESAGGDLEPYIGPYRDAARRLADRAGAPVALSPNLHGDCYGIAAALCAAEAPDIRVVAWNHSPIEYNDRVLAHYERVIARFVGVSDRIEADLRRHLPGRHDDIVNIPYGVPVAASPPRRETLSGRPVRLIYTGRMDHAEKRVMVLAALSAELDRRGIDHELTLVGDGPAAGDLDEAIAGMAAVRRLGPVPPRRIERLLERHDALVLASRYEGLSVSMLEAMARGCVPIVTRVESGAAQAIEPGRSGELADVPPDPDDADVASALADAVERFLAGSPRACAEAAWRTARDRFSIERHAAAVEKMLAGAVADPPRAWPADRPCAFTSVPPGGADQLAELLGRLGGRRIIVHGTGRHTRQLAGVLAGSPALIVAFANDDRQEHGTSLLDRPVVSPRQAAATGATDVVISSWINQQTIWDRRAVYERQGLAVHRVYPE